MTQRASHATPRTIRRLRANRPRLGLVIFDCDGVLIDSEPLTDRVIVEVLTEEGWPISVAECHRRFVGLSFYDMQPMIETQLGRPLGPGWIDGLVIRLSAALAAEVNPIQGAGAALEATSALGLPWRIASNSSHTEMAAKFARAGLTSLVAGRVHSAVDVIAAGGRGKPAPDVFLAAAAAGGVTPDACIVVEDSIAGVQGAIAAGMDCLGFSPTGDGSRLRALGALPFHALAELPRLLWAALENKP
jgi:beta-phosphoglucomutase-like phosphatase (HAD superfamily)